MVVVPPPPPATFAVIIRSSIKVNIRLIMRLPPSRRKARKANTPVSLLAQI